MKRILLLLIACVMVFGIGSTSHALSVDTAVTSVDMVNAILGPGISLVPGPIFDGAAGTGGGLFSDGLASGLGIDTGIIMSTGFANQADGPNITGPETLGVGDTSDDTSGILNLPGDVDLTALAGFNTFDANLLEFDFQTATGDLFFNFVFASEEYIDYVNSAFNDVFGFFVDGTNIGLVPGTSTPITINTVNPLTNSSFYVNNVSNTNGYPVAGADTAYDGFTTVITAEALGIGAGEHHMKLGIADGSDSILDAAVFIQEGSFSGEEPAPVPEPSTMLLLGAGLLGLAGFGRKKFFKK